MLKLIKAAFKRNHSFVFESALLPKIQLQTQQHIQKLDSVHIGSYHKCVKWQEASELQLHPCYFHLLAFEQHMQLMLNDEFPFALLGIVHLSNEIEVMASADFKAGFEVSSEIRRFKRHQKGITFIIESTIRQNKTLIWHSTSQFLAINTKARTGKSRSQPFQLADDMTIIDNWHCDKSVGWQYGKISGDFNPIHLSSLSAKLFGFKSAIAHGMWSKARCLSALQSQLPEAFKCKVEFHKPLFLPAKVSLYKAIIESESQRFQLTSHAEDTCHLEGYLYRH